MLLGKSCADIGVSVEVSNAYNTFVVMLISTLFEMQLFNLVLSRTHYMAHLGSTSRSAVLRVRPMDIQALCPRIEPDCVTIHGTTYFRLSVI